MSMRLRAKALLLLACISISVSAQSIPPNAVAVVNGQAISQDLFDQLLRANVSQGLKDSPQLRQAIKDDLINRVLLIQRAEKLGLDKTPEAQSIKTLKDQTYVGNKIVIGDDLTLRSELGSIEMVTGLDPITGKSTPIDGLDKTTFSLGSPDKDLGAGLKGQAKEQSVTLQINRDPYVPPTPVPPPGPTPEPTPGPTPELPAAPGTPAATPQSASTNQAVDSGEPASSNRILVSSASSVMGNYASAMSNALNTEKQLDLQEAVEQGDVSVGELTDLQCARDEIQIEDCKTDLPGKREQ